MSRYRTIGPKPAPVAERPKCLACRKPLRPHWRTKWEGQGRDGGFHFSRELDGYGDYGDSHFCTLRCGYFWAVKVAGKCVSAPVHETDKREGPSSTKRPDHEGTDHDA